MKERTLKKSELNIQDAYDYGRITMRREHLIPCSLQEEDEDIILHFDMNGLKPLSDIRQAKEENKLLLLMDAMQLDALMGEYQFELGPDNLFYDEKYIRSEDLTAEQKENILASFNLTSNEKIMEYWIHIGRLEVQEAENIAMQYSDNELLLYAYMKDKALTETKWCGK